ncbi:MAG: hypothetical protein ACI8VW_000110, partial [bacterium]
DAELFLVIGAESIERTVFAIYPVRTERAR